MKLVNKATKRLEELKKYFKNFKPDFGDDILRPHNQKVYKKMIRGLSSSNKILVEQATGTGKTYLMIKFLKDHAQGKRVLYISPTNAIQNYFLEKVAGNLSDEDSNFDLQTVLYPSVKNVAKNEYDIIIIDEVHHVGGKEWGKAVDQLLTNNPDAVVIGMTATMERSDGVDITRWFDGKKPVSSLTLVDALQMGILESPDYTIAKVNFEDDEKFVEETTKTLKEKLKTASPEEKKVIVKLLEDLKVAKKIISGRKEIPDIVTEKLNTPELKNGKFIVFCPPGADDETGSLILDTVVENSSSWFKGGLGKNVRKYVIHSRYDDEHNEKTLKAFEEDNKPGLKLLYCVDMLNEGVHVEDVDGVIMLRTTQSNRIYTQQLGRVLNVESKKQKIVLDLVANLNTVEVNRIKNMQKTVNKGYVEDDDEEINLETDEKKKTKNKRDFKVQVENLDEIQFIEELKENVYNYENDWFTPFLQKLIAYRDREILDKNGNVKKPKGSFEFVTSDPEIGNQVSAVRQAYKGKGSYILTNEMKKKLEEIGFPWENDWFTPFLEKLIAYRDKEIIDENGNVKKPKGSFEFVASDPEIGKQVNTVRQAYKGNNGTRLTDDMINQLNQIGFPWDAVLELWLKMLNKLIEFVNKNKRYPKSRTENKDEHNLSQWISTQRRELAKPEADEFKVKKLKEIGFVWESQEDILEKQWLETYNKVVDFKNKHKRLPKSVEENKQLTEQDKIENNLYEWMQRQRIKNDKNDTENYRVQKLNEIGFVWDPNEEKWWEKYNKVVDFKNKHKRFPNQIKKPKQKTQEDEIENSLYTWLLIQRAKLDRNDTENYRVQKLNEIGFVWESNEEILEKQWLEKYNKLVDFKNKYGRFPKAIDKEKRKTEEDEIENTLFIWLVKQRANLDKNNTEDYRVQKLNEIGYVWESREEIFEKQWLETYNKVVEFKNKHGRFPNRIKKKDLTDEEIYENRLGNWLINQKQKLDKNKTEDYRVQKLNEIGFVWESNEEFLEKQWLEKYNKLVEFKKKYGRFPKRIRKFKQKTEQDKMENSLYDWLIGQRANLDKNNTEDYRVQKLNEIGFDWRDKEVDASVD